MKEPFLSAISSFSYRQLQVLERLLGAKLLSIKAGETSCGLNREVLLARSRIAFLDAKRIADLGGLDFERLRAASEISG